MTILTPRRVEYIFDGRADRAWLDPSSHDLLECEEIAKEIHDKGGRPTDFPNPMGLALGHKNRLVPCAMPNCGDELSDGVHILYKPTVDPRQQGLVILHGVVHNFCVRRHHGVNEAAAWLITGSVALLKKYRRWTLPQAVAAQRYVPKWLIELRLSLLWQRTAGFWAAE